MKSENTPNIEQQAHDLIVEGQLTQAEALLRPFLDSGGGPIALWRLLVRTISPQRKIAEVCAILEMLVQAFPGDLGMRFDLAEILLLQGNFTRGWRARLANLSRLLVALVWAGRPTCYNDARRSMTLANLANLAQLALPRVTFLALQKGLAAVQACAAPEGMTLVCLSNEILDFEDRVATLNITDLLISVDSLPIHLAGALGRPAWVMLPFVAEWCWLLERNDSPWYPSLRLFRQSRADDWQAVLQAMATALGALKAEMKPELNALVRS